MKGKALYHVIVATVALALFAAACSSTDSDSGGEAPNGTPSRTALEIAGAVPAVPLTPYDSVIGMLALSPMYTPLIAVDNNNELYSDMLESWEISTDARTVTLNLRSDIEWNDGTPVTSADVVMSLTQYLDPNISIWASDLGGVAGQSAFADGTADSISGLSAPDDVTVLVELEEPNTAWLANLATLAWNIPVLPHHVLGEVPHDELLEHEFFKAHPVTNGPYQFVEYIADQYMELEKNPSWSLGKPGFERVFIKAVAPDVRTAQLETGEVQFASNIPLDESGRIDSIDGIEMQSTPGTSSNDIILRYTEPLLDPRIRQAMIYAIDREGICSQVLAGDCTVPLANVEHLGPEWAIPTDGLIEYRYDPQRARELLDDAGWDPDTELTLLTIERTEELAIIQDNMADVGIKWNIVEMAGPEITEAVERGDLDGQWIGRSHPNVDPSAAQSITECSSRFPAGRNRSLYCDPELDALWAQGRQTTEQSERADIYHEAFGRLNQNPAFVTVHVRDRLQAFDSRLKGLEINPDGTATFWNIGEWHWED